MTGTIMAAWSWSVWSAVFCAAIAAIAAGVVADPPAAETDAVADAEHVTD